MSRGLDAVEFEVTIAVVTPLSMMTSATHDKAVALITVARETAERVLAGDSGGSALPIRIAAQRVVARFLRARQAVAPPSVALSR